MTRAEVVSRARSQLSKGIVYVLGSGGRHPESDTCAAKVVNQGGLVNGCDCSGFAAWCWKIDRYLDPAWFETSAIVHEANQGGWQTKHGLISSVAWKAALPGDCLVYGDHDGHQGHIGIVSEVTEEGPASVVHCSLSAFHRTGDAISETDPSIFMVHGAIVVAASWVHSEVAA